MSDSTLESKPIPVMSVPAAFADLLETCAKHGNIMVGEDKNVSLSSAGLMAAMTDPNHSVPEVESFREQCKIWIHDPASLNAMKYTMRETAKHYWYDPIVMFATIFDMIDAAHILGDDRVCTMVIVNKSDKQLDFSTGDKGKGYNSFNGGYHHGRQTGHPGTMTKTEGSFSDEYIIPAATNDDGVQYYGIGMFKFQKNNGFLGAGWYGTQGCIGANLDGGNTLKISLLVGQSTTTAIAAHTGSTSFEDFLNANWDPGKSITISTAASPGGAVTASMYPASGLYLNNESDHENMAATVVFYPG